MDDGRINAALGDQLALILPGTDDGDSPELHVYSVNEEGGADEFLLAITQEDIAPYVDNPPPQNTLILSHSDIAFYVLDTGEFQVNLGPDADGRMWAIIIDGIPARLIYGYEVNAGR